MARPIANEPETLTSTEFDLNLAQIGITATPISVRRWSHEGLLTPPLGATSRTRWPVESLMDAALIFTLREGDALFSATPLGVSVLLTMVRSLKSGPDAWSSFWTSDEERTVGDVVWRPRTNPFHSSIVVAGVCAYFKAGVRVPIRDPRSVRLAWVDKNLIVTIEAERADEEGVPVGDSISVPPSKAMLRAIKNARAGSGFPSKAAMFRAIQNARIGDNK